MPRRIIAAAKTLLITATLLLVCILMIGGRLHAQDYNCGTYGTGTYGTQEGSEACETEEDLENTGQQVIIGLAVGGLLVAAGVASFVLTYKRRGKARK